MNLSALAAKQGRELPEQGQGITVTVCRRRERAARIGREPTCSSHPLTTEHRRPFNPCAATTVLDRGEQGK
jgi:hypothetical protein